VVSFPALKRQAIVSRPLRGLVVENVFHPSPEVEFSRTEVLGKLVFMSKVP
jgi:hypothetical protein